MLNEPPRDHDWWTDEPVLDKVEDKFGRLPFVERIVAILGDVAIGTKSTVLGLVGPWGSGKTSTLNMIVASMQADTWGVAWVNPWALSGPDSVVTELLGAVSAALPADGKPAKRARSALARYGVYAAPLLSVVPLVGGALGEVSKEAMSRLAGQGTLQEEAQRVAAELANVARPILIIIDDVDRLQPEELLALFKAVRVLGRMPNIHYLLAYDEQTVIDVLRATAIASGHHARAVAFLEKIVTLRLDQPPTRAGQAEVLFNRGLERALIDADAVINEDQFRRLADEHERLLSRVLVEPRAVARLLTQVRIYLPLLGAGEIDLVDFIVLTFLRVTYPGLYRALSAHRAALTGVTDYRDQQEVAALFRPDRIINLGVPESDSRSAADAIGRLFPLLGDEAALVRRLRKRSQRASDADHVDRYFALIPPLDDLPDSVLMAALLEWIEARPSSAADRVRSILAPDPSDQLACALATRVLRRAEARSEGLSVEQSGALLKVVLGLLPPLANARLSMFGPNKAAVAWVARLIAQADGPPPSELLRIVERPAEMESPLGLLLRALSLVVPEPIAITLPQLINGDLKQTWLSRLIAAAAEVTWRRFIAHVRLGDVAPDESPTLLLSWLDAALGSDEIDRRLATAVDGGLPISDLGARLVETSTNLATREVCISGFDAANILRRLGLARVNGFRSNLDIAAELDGLEGIGEQDVTWANRRRVAARGIRNALDAARLDPRSLLPILPTLQDHPFLNFRPSVLYAPGSEEPDFGAQLSILVPAGHALPRDNNPPASLMEWDRENVIIGLVAASPIAQWLNEAAVSWHVKPGDWEVKHTDGRVLTAIALAAHAVDPGSGGWRQQTPILLGAQIQTVETTDPVYGAPAHDTVLLTLKVGLWLTELDASRRPAKVRHSSSPLPAALSLAEFYELVDALCASTELAGDSIRSLFRDVQNVPAEALVHLSLTAPDGVGAVVDLSAIRRVGEMTRARHEQVFSVSTTSTVGSDLPHGADVRDLAVYSIGEWLLQSGYRGYERALHKLWLPGAEIAP